MSNEMLLSLASVRGMKTLVVIDSRVGNPSAISFTSIQRDLNGDSPLNLRVLGVKLRRELAGENKITRAKKLAVLKGEGGAALEQLIKKLAGFLEGDLVETIHDVKRQSEHRDGCVLLLAEEGSEEITLRFFDAKSLGELGPEIRAKLEDVSPNDAGG
jgi:rRNA maturation protein Rpf1